MISAACPATYVSRPRKSLPTLHAVEPAGDALEAMASSAATVSPIRSSARCTWPCHRRQRTCSTASAKRAPSCRSSFVMSGQPLTAWATCWMRIARWNQSSTCQVGPTRRLSQRPRPVGAIAEDGELRARCCAKAMQHAAQLLGLPIGLDRHAAEDDLLTIIVAGLRNEHLEGPYLIAAHRAHVTGVDGQRDRLRVCRRRRRRWRHDRRALQSGADLQGPTLDGVDCREITEREEGLQQGASAAVGQQGTELGQHALILWGAVIGHDLRHRREDRAQGHTALAGLKPRSAELNRAEQRPQLPWPPILERPLSTTSRAASPDLAVLLGLRLNKMALQAGQDRLGLCERQSQRRRRAAGRGAAAGVRLMHLLGANCAGQLHHHPSLHPASPISVIRPVLPRSARYPPPFGRSPPAMVDAVRGWVAERGVTPANLYYEKFL